MAEGRDNLPATVTAEPEAIREEMAQTRAALTGVLTTLKRRLFDTIQPSTMGDTTAMATAKKKPTTKQTEEAASTLGRAKGGSKKGGTRKTAAKATPAASKGASSRTKKTSSKAASSPSRKRTGKGKTVASKTKEVLGDVLAGAAAGAAAGAIQAATETLLPDNKSTGGEAHVEAGVESKTKTSKTRTKKK